MAQTSESFKELLALGVEGEHVIGQLLINRGVNLLPLYQFKNHETAPLIYGKEIENLRRAAPDLTCFKNGKAWFVEVKTKRRWVKYSDELETGLDAKAYSSYKAIKDATGLKVYVFFLHKEQEPTGIYYAELDQYTRFWDGKYNGERKHDPMYFYSMEVIQQIE